MHVIHTAILGGKSAQVVACTKCRLVKFPTIFREAVLTELQWFTDCLRGRKQYLLSLHGKSSN